MREILEFIIKNIATIPDEVVITEEEIEGVTTYSVSVNKEDVGRVIGKEGKIIKSIRAIMRVIAIQRGLRIRISVISDVVETTSNKEESVETTTPNDQLTVEL